METWYQNKAAEFLGISEGYLSKILSGKSCPRPGMIKKLSKKTKSDASIWLFGDREKKEHAIKKAMIYSKGEAA